MYSSLAYRYIPMSSSHYTQRNRRISAVVIHYTASIVTDPANTVYYWEDNNPYTSANYIIDVNGRIAAVVPEELRAYTSSSWGKGVRDIDDRAITIECSCNYIPPDISRSDLYTESEATISALVKLLADIGKRYNITWNFTGDESGNIHAHKWYDDVSFTPCPGAYLYGRFGEIAQRANALMEENKPMTADEKKELDDVKSTVDKHTEPKYNKVEDLPSWYRNEIQWLVDNGYLKGNDKGLQLSEDMARLLVIVARMLME